MSRLHFFSFIFSIYVSVPKHLSYLRLCKTSRHIIKAGGFRNMKLKDNIWKNKKDKNALVS